MSRFLFWIILIIVIGFAVRAKLRAAVRKSQLQQQEQWRQYQQQQQQQQRGRQAEPASIENMTSCAHCGLHFPASEAVRADGLDYCSPAHVRLPPR